MDGKKEKTMTLRELGILMARIMGYLPMPSVKIPQPIKLPAPRKRLENP
jgi:hypothetical protein